MLMIPNRLRPSELMGLEKDWVAVGVFWGTHADGPL